MLGVLAAVLLNAGVCVAATALLYGPALLLPRRAYTIHHVAAVGLGSFSAVAFVTYCVGRAGGNVRLSLWLVAFLLAAATVVGVVLTARDAVARVVGLARVRSVWIVVGLSVVVAVVAELPAPVLLAKIGVSAGLIALSNHDIGIYPTVARNFLDNGFAPGDVVGQNLGWQVDVTHPGTLSLEGLDSFLAGGMLGAPIPTIMVASVIGAVSVYSLVRAIWPTCSSVTAFASTWCACLISLNAYVRSEYFLASLFCSGCVAALAAGIILSARSRSLLGPILTMAAVTAGLFAYAETMIFASIAAPVAAACAAFLLHRFERSPRSELPGGRRTTVVVTVAVVEAWVISMPMLIESVGWIRRTLQSGAGGWDLGPLGVDATLWGGAPSLQGGSGNVPVVAGWVVVVVAAFVLIRVARVRLGRRDAVLAGVIAASVVAVVVVVAVRVGAAAYQTWKLEGILLPIACAAALPPVFALLARSARWSTVSVGVAVVVAGASPWLVWRPAFELTDLPDEAITGTPATLLDAVHKVDDEGFASVNVRLPNWTQNMGAGLAFSKTRVAFPDHLYLPPVTALDTCTLTTRSMISDADTPIVPLAGDYVLVPYPSPCKVTDSSDVTAPTIPAFFQNPVGGGLWLQFDQGTTAPAPPPEFPWRWIDPDAIRSVFAARAAAVSPAYPVSLGSSATAEWYNAQANPVEVRASFRIATSPGTSHVSVTIGDQANDYVVHGRSDVLNVRFTLSPGTNAFQIGTDAAAIDSASDTRLVIHGVSVDALPAKGAN